MFERFSERARQAVVLAQEEARSLKHNYIGTEHILLGLLREKDGLAARVLESLGVTNEQVRSEVVRIVGSGEEATSGAIPFTPRAKKVLELALREALSLSHNYIGTEHILLGLMRENEGIAVRVLSQLDVDAERVRDELLQILPEPWEGQGETLHAPEARGASASSRAPSPAPRQRPSTGWLAGLETPLEELAREIRAELGREPDPGDLLLVLACLPDATPAAALRELGVDLDALAATIESLRQQQATAPATDALGAIRRRLGLSG